MGPIHLAGEMAVWSEEQWAAFEGDLQRQLRAERRRIARIARRRERAQFIIKQTAVWSVLAVTLLLALFY